MMGAFALTAVRNAAYTLASLLAVLGLYQILDAQSYCDLDPCSGPRADPGLVLQMWMGLGFLVVAGLVALAGVMLHRKLRSRFPALFPPGSGWKGTRNTVGFLTIFAFLAAGLQWQMTGEPWSPSECDHDGTPIEECPDYGYDSSQVRSLWIAAGYLTLAVVGLVVTVYAHLKVKRGAKPLPAALPTGPNDLVSRRLLWGAVGSLVLACACFAIGRFDRVGFAYAGVMLAAIAVGSALTCLVWPRSNILTKWSAVVLVAVGSLAGFANYAVIVLSQL